MRNRAKCKLCNSIIESFSSKDWITCKCEALHLIGGEENPRARFNHPSEMVMIDDNGNEVELKENVEKTNINPEENVRKLNKEDYLEMLDQMIKGIEELPVHAGTAPITHYDFSALLSLLSCLFRST